MATRTDQDNRPTRLSLRALRADALRRLLLSPRGQVATVADICRLPDLASWGDLVLEIAIGDLVADGLLADDAYGRINVEPIAGSAS